MGALGPCSPMLFQFLPRLDPRRRSYEKFQRYYEATALVLTAFVSVMMGTVLLEILRPGAVSMGRVVSALVGLLFLFIGNMMGKVKSNFFLGIRNPWTLSDPDVWNRAHRLGGALFFLAGPGDGGLRPAAAGDSHLLGADGRGAPGGPGPHGDELCVVPAEGPVRRGRGGGINTGRTCQNSHETAREALPPAPSAFP